MSLVRTVTRLWCETCGDLDPGRSKPERVLDRHSEQHRHIVHLTTTPVTRPGEPRDDR